MMIGPDPMIRIFRMSSRLGMVLPPSLGFGRDSDAKLGEQDRKEYAKVLESLRAYISGNNEYGKVRDLPSTLRYLK